MPEFETILVTTVGRVGFITLNRPKALNALNSQVMNDVTAAATSFDENPGIGAIVITGSEKAFAAGADIKEMSTKSYSDMLGSAFFAGWEALTRVRKPVIASVAGYALGGGCELAMMCDVLIAADNAVFGQPEIKLGVIPGIGGSQRLTRAIGKAKAMDMILTGRPMNVDEAERMGLVSRVVPLAELEKATLDLATEIATKSLPTSILAKEAVNTAFETTLADGIRAERALFYGTFATDDQTEGMAAFIEKRDPSFGHR